MFLNKVKGNSLELMLYKKGFNAKSANNFLDIIEDFLKIYEGEKNMAEITKL